MSAPKQHQDRGADGDQRAAGGARGHVQERLGGAAGARGRARGLRASPCAEREAGHAQRQVDRRALGHEAVVREGERARRGRPRSGRRRRRGPCGWWPAGTRRRSWPRASAAPPGRWPSPRCRPSRWSRGPPCAAETAWASVAESFVGRAVGEQDDRLRSAARWAASACGGHLDAAVDGGAGVAAGGEAGRGRWPPWSSRPGSATDEVRLGAEGVDAQRVARLGARARTWSPRRSASASFWPCMLSEVSITSATADWLSAAWTGRPRRPGRSRSPGGRASGSGRASPP